MRSQAMAHAQSSFEPKPPHLVLDFDSYMEMVLVIAWVLLPEDYKLQHLDVMLPSSSPSLFILRLAQSI